MERLKFMVTTCERFAEGLRSAGAGGGPPAGSIKTAVAWSVGRSVGRSASLPQSLSRTTSPSSSRPFVFVGEQCDNIVVAERERMEKAEDRTSSDFGRRRLWLAMAVARGMVRLGRRVQSSKREGGSACLIFFPSIFFLFRLWMGSAKRLKCFKRMR